MEHTIVMYRDEELAWTLINGRGLDAHHLQLLHLLSRTAGADALMRHGYRGHFAGGPNNG